MQFETGTMQTETSGSNFPPGLCVLVAEDDEADAYLICRALARQPGIGKVVHVPDGVVALWMVEHGQVSPDLAFVDLKMPRIGGLGLLVALAERTESEFPVVVLTSSNAPLDATRSRLRGAFRVITKPETVEALEFELASAVAARILRRFIREPVARRRAGTRRRPFFDRRTRHSSDLRPGNRAAARGPW